MDSNPFPHKSAQPPPSPSHTASEGVAEAPPLIPDHQLIRCIGRGSYGSVWLAQNTMGTFRAVKVVYRKSFNDGRPFERELAGIRKFEPISRTHEGFVHVLHVGMSQEQGCFYYIMELGDDQNSGQDIDPATYIPRTLGKDISLKGSLPMEECLRLGLALSLALDELHKRGLVHRDVKPSNIIFVNGVPKLADIGLVADINDARSYVGTEGFIPPEGPGLAQADVYGLGKVLYEASTGKDRQEFPELPTLLDQSSEREKLLELNEVILQACKNEVTRRYQSAWDMHADLLVLVNGKSVRRLKILEERLSRLKRIATVSALVISIVAFFLYQVYRQWQSARQANERQIRESVAFGNRALESGDVLKSLPSFAEALRLSQGDQTQKSAHRLLFNSALAQCPKLNQMWFLGGEVRDGNFSADGTRVILPEYKAQTGIYDVASGILSDPTFCHGGLVASAVLSPDGQFALTASEDNVACIWNAKTRELLHTLSHPQPVLSVRFSPNGLWGLTACHDGSVRLWNIQAGDLKLVFKAHTNGLRFANFSPNGQLVVTASEDKTARLWDATTGLAAGPPLAHGSWVNYAAFSPDGKVMVTASSDHKARLWEVATGRQLLIDLNHRDGVESAEFSPDGRMLVTASLDGTARTWRLENLQSIAPILALRHSAGVTHACFGPDGHHILTTCTDGTVRIWDLAGSAVPPVAIRASAGENGSRLVTISSNQMAIWNAVSNNLACPPLTLTTPLMRTCLSQSGRFVLCLSPLKTNRENRLLLQVRDTGTGQEVAPEILVSNTSKGAALSDDGKLVLLFGGNVVQGWDLVNRTNFFRPLTFEEPIKMAIFNRECKRIGVGYGKTFQVLDLSGKAVLPPFKHSRPIVHAAFSHKGSLLATCCSDDQINKCYAQLWDASTGKPGHEFWHSDGVLSVAFSPDDKRLVTASEDFTAKIWDTDTGKQSTPDLNHEDKVRTAVFSPDGKWVITACDDKTARVWNVTSGDPLTPPLRHLVPLVKAQFLAGERQIITFDKQGNAWIWNLPQEDRADSDVTKLALLLASEKNTISESAASQKLVSLKTLWRELRPKYPSVFITSSNETYAWHAFEAQKCGLEK